MAITSAAKKAIKRSTFLRSVNLQYKLAMKKSIKDLKKWVDAGLWSKDLVELLRLVFSSVDKAAKKNIIHKKNASRKKMRLNKMVKVSLWI